jgi:hypothetical protein
MEYKREIQKREDILIKQDEALELQNEAILILREQNRLLLYYYMNGDESDQLNYYKPKNNKQYNNPI